MPIIQSMRVLHDVLHCQYGIGCDVYVDHDTQTLRGVTDGPSSDPKHVRKFRYSSAEMNLAFSDLIGLGYLVDPYDHFCLTVRVTQSGNHLFQSFLSSFCTFLFRSVLVPVIVSAATSLLIVWLEGLITAASPVI